LSICKISLKYFAYTGKKMEGGDLASSTSREWTRTAPTHIALRVLIACFGGRSRRESRWWWVVA